MAAFLETVQITIPAAGQGGVAKTYYFQTKKDAYKGDISTASGVFKAADTFDNDEPIIPIHQLVISGKLMRLHAECKTSGGKKKLVEMLVRRDLVEEALAQPTGSLEGKTFGTYGTIKTVRSVGMDSYR